MKLSTLFVVPAICISAVAGTSPCAAGDRCQRGVGGIAGDPPLSSRLADCKSLDVVTVSPYTVTTTVTESQLVVRIPTGMPTKRHHEYLADMVHIRALTPTTPTATATTILPTEKPDYATYCASAAAYFSACSRAGVTASTTTLATPTYTSTVSREDCYVRRAVKRSGEALGYEYPEGWESYNMPGIKLF